MSPIAPAEAARTSHALVEGIAASQALASRERQAKADAKRSGSKKISLAGPTLSTEADIVMAKRADYARSEADRLASRPSAIKLPKGMKLTGTYDEVRSGGEVKVRTYEDATPERINQARAGEEVETVAGVRQFSDPFKVLGKTGRLDKEPSVNSALYQAGEDLRRRYDMADLGGVKAMNLMKDIVDGGAGDAGCPISDRAFDARRKIRSGHAAVGPRLWPYLIGVVIEDRTVESMVGLVQDSKSDRLRYVIAMERLREALHRLCEAWNIRPNDKPGAIQSIREGVEDRSFERRTGAKKVGSE